MYFIGILDDVGASIGAALRSAAGWIIAQMFTLIEYLYKIFNYLSMTQIVDNEFVQKIYSKVGMILGIFMVFKLLFSLVNSLISPDKLNDKKSGAAAVVTRCIFSIVLLGLTPTIFKEAFSLQKILVGGTAGNNVLYKLISNKPASKDADIGHLLASDLYLSFFTDNEEPFLNNGTIDTIYESDAEYLDRFKDDNYENLANNLRDSEIPFTFDDTIDYLVIKGVGDKNTAYVIEFQFLVLLVVGALVIWMLAMYCVQVGVRVVQLAYLQLIAPIPILSYISDPDGSFKTWIKQCVSTYLDLFIRLTLIYFVITLVGDVIEQFEKTSGIIFDSAGLYGESWFTINLIKIIIIIALLLFAKRAPELLKELFPKLGGGVAGLSFGLNPKKEIYEPLNSTAIGRLATAPVRFAGKKAKGFIDTAKKNRATRIEGRKEARDNQLMYNKGKSLFEKYGNDISSAFSGEYAETYKELKNAKANASSKELAFDAASDALKEARKTNDQARIDAAQKAYNKALSEKRDADKYVETAKKRHDISRKKYARQAEIEDNYGYYKTRSAISGLSSTQTQSVSQPQPASQSQSDSASYQPQSGSQDGVINEKTSMFANMSDAEFNLRQSENYDVANTDPNDYFDTLSDAFAEDYLNNSVSEQNSKDFDAQWARMEEAYKNAGWSKDDNGKWNKDNK